MLIRAILAEYQKELTPELSRVVEDDLSEERIKELNDLNYNIYYLPNYPSSWSPKQTVDGSQIDTFKYCFVDMDLKEGIWTNREEFREALEKSKLTPSATVDSGGGIHAYWEVSDLDALSFLKLQRRLCRLFKTDEAVCKVYQLMRLPATNNVKVQGQPRPCTILSSNDTVYSAEQMDKWLPKLTPQDEIYCQQHYERTYKLQPDIKVNYTIPHKFHRLLRSSREVKELYSGDSEDRSKGDWKLAHLMHADRFTKDEAMSVLVNCAKAISRSELHRNNYALNIVEKVWGFEAEDNKETVHISNSVKDILRRGVGASGGRLFCWEVFDATERGFRKGHVMGLIGGSGSGKTTLTLNYMYWFAKLNPDHHHLFFSGEQPEEEIAEAWLKLCGDADETLLEKLHILGNYEPNGTYKNLSLYDIEEYALSLQKQLKVKLGCLGIDHIGILKKQSRDGETQGLMDICHHMKAVAKNTDTFLIMQSQTSREKAGRGDIELDKDAAFGTSLFENYCDWLVTSWQPLKRIYKRAPNMTCNAYKYAKIRHKNVLLDKIQEDSVQVLMFNPETKRLDIMTETDESAYDHWNGIANQLRGKDLKREPTRRTKIDWVGSSVCTMKNTNSLRGDSSGASFGTSSGTSLGASSGASSGTSSGTSLGASSGNISGGHYE